MNITRKMLLNGHVERTTVVRESIAWSGMAYLYHFEHHGKAYTIFSSSIDQARDTISGMYGIYVGALDSLIQ